MEDWLTSKQKPILFGSQYIGKKYSMASLNG